MEGRNVLIDYRWIGSDPGRGPAFAAELVGLAPDVLLTTHTPLAKALQSRTRTIPIVFATLSDPVGSGLVSNLARPGDNITGFTGFEYSLAGKWLELLREIAPGVARVDIIFNPDAAPYAAKYVQAAEGAAQSLAVTVTAVAVRNAIDIERTISALAIGGGLIVAPDYFTNDNREPISALAGEYRVPAIYPTRRFVTAGGLLSYGPDVNDIYRRAASYVDHILKGEKVTDLPVQQPTKFELVINIKAAKALGLEVPPTLLVRADEVIE
jgi:putative ABC transport system substrate-binding protein